MQYEQDISKKPGIAALAGATIVLDLDGTVVDSAPNIVAAVNFSLESEGLDPIRLREARPLIANGARQLLRYGLEQNGRDPSTEPCERLFARFLSYYEAHPSDLTKAFPGVCETLECLQKSGAGLVVCTTKTTGLAKLVLSSLDLSSFFAGVVGADLTSASKPDAAHVLQAIEAVSGDPTTSVMIGDAEPDARAARAAGIPIALVTFGYSHVPVDRLPHDLLIDRFDQVVPACRKLLSERRKR
ncbi:HAD-IA family hydrolase [Qipengyuania qiaonensis]|uniref:phosphoglycolate phosphatase n=1 Tax=Qipengyuania qiaonensis TaxID=2867240 RepID=A0ABS7JCJ5_9SPHN|nr:HAD-IA family hydrolase [Qipengyuania qiaonensis]